MNEDSDIFCLTGASVLREWENNFCLYSNQLGIYTESSRVFGLDPSIYPLLVGCAFQGSLFHQIQTESAGARFRQSSMINRIQDCILNLSLLLTSLGD